MMYQQNKMEISTKIIHCITSLDNCVYNFTEIHSEGLLHPYEWTNDRRNQTEITTVLVERKD